jgi:ATP-dependent RNA helicase HelY
VLPREIGTVVLPGTYAPNRKDYRSEVGRRVRSAKLSPLPEGGAKQVDRLPVGHGIHPVEDDPDLRHRLQAAADADRVEREIADLERRVDRRHASLARDFDAVLAVLADRGHVDVGRWKLSEWGVMLSKIFHESDLLIAESLRLGLLDGVDAPTLAGLASTFVYEHRSPDDPPPPWFPDRSVRARWDSIDELSAEIRSLEVRHGVAEHRPPEPTFFAIASAWIAGDGFAEVVGEEELTGGDFVRTMKQLIDVLGQIAVVAPDSETRRVARAAADAAYRGVVSDASAVEPA